MSLIFYKTIAGIVILITSLATVIYPIKVRAHPQHNFFLELGDALASGVFLGAALFHMLPDAHREFSEVFGNNYYPLAELFCAGGFLLLLFLERLSQYHSNENFTHTVPYVFALILTIHALVEGIALGINTTIATALVIFIAIIAHKGSESFALAVILNRSNMTLTRIITIIGLFSLMTPLGIVLGTLLTESLQFKTGALVTAGFTAFAAGTFLYMSTLHHINHHLRSHSKEGMLEFVVLLVGLSTMGIIALWTV